MTETSENRPNTRPAPHVEEDGVPHLRPDEARQGEIVLRNRKFRWSFFIGALALAILAMVLAFAVAN